MANKPATAEKPVTETQAPTIGLNPEQEAAESASKASMTPPAPVFRREAAVVLPTYSLDNLKPDESKFLKLLAEPVTVPQLKDDGEQKIDEDGNPMFITSCAIRDLETGREGNMVLPFMIRRAFDEFKNANDGHIVGQCFEIKRGAKRNRTFEYAVYKIANIE